MLKEENLDESNENIEPQPVREIVIFEQEVKLKRTVTFNEQFNEENDDNVKQNTEHIRSQETFEKLLNEDKELNQNIGQRELSIKWKIL